MKKHHWVIVFDEQNKWHIEPEVEEEVQPQTDVKLEEIK